MHRHLLSLLALLTVACAHSGNAPWYVPTGSTVTINQPITIPSESASVKIQSGKPMSFQDINQYAPYCVLEVHKRMDTPQEVKPGQFTVTKNVQRDYYTSVAPQIVASVGSSSSGPIHYINDIYLTSPERDDVFRLSCQQYSDPWQFAPGQRWATVNQMQIALGQLITLSAATKSPGTGR